MTASDRMTGVGVSDTGFDASESPSEGSLFPLFRPRLLISGDIHHSILFAEKRARMIMSPRDLFGGWPFLLSFFIPVLHTKPLAQATPALLNLTRRYIHPPGLLSRRPLNQRKKRSKTSDASEKDDKESFAAGRSRRPQERSHHALFQVVWTVCVLQHVDDGHSSCRFAREWCSCVRPFLCYCYDAFGFVVVILTFFCFYCVGV